MHIAITPDYWNAWPTEDTASAIVNLLRQGETIHLLPTIHRTTPANPWSMNKPRTS